MSKILKVYGIRQCDSCRKALKWLTARGIDHEFHDIRDDGLDEEKVEAWLASPHAEKLLNRRSITWRSLDENDRVVLPSVRLLLRHPTLIKRPVFESSKRVLAVGFRAAERAILEKEYGV